MMADVHSPELQNFPCLICGKVFYRQENFTVHQLKHLSGYDCLHCAAPNQTFEDLQNHKRYLHSTFGGGDEAAEFVPDWKLKHTGTDKNTKFKKKCSSYTAQLVNSAQLPPSLENLQKIFTSLFETVLPDVGESDMIGVTFESPSLDFPIVIPYTTKTNLTSGEVFKVIERSLNSNESFSLDSRLKLAVDHIEMPVGSGGQGKKVAEFTSLAEALKKKRTVIRIRSDDDHLCLATAVLVGIEHYKAFKTREQHCYENYKNCQ